MTGPMTGCGVRIAAENVCDGCGKRGSRPRPAGLTRNRAEHLCAIRFEINGGGSDHKLNTGGFYHVA